MTKETAEAFGTLIDRLTRPAVTVMFCFAICYMGMKTVQNISADQFVGIVMAVVMFWFGTRTGTSGTTTTTTSNGTTVTETPKP